MSCQPAMQCAVLSVFGILLSSLLHVSSLITVRFSCTYQVLFYIVIVHSLHPLHSHSFTQCSKFTFSNRNKLLAPPDWLYG